MHIEARTLRAMVILSAVLLLTSCKTTVGVAVNPADYPLLQQPTHAEVVRWRKLSGRCFFGQPKGDKAAGIGFHRYFEQPGVDPVLREWPEDARLIGGTLGAFQVEWHQVSSATTPRFWREAVFDFGVWSVTVPNWDRHFQITEKMSVWVWADDESQVEELAEYLGGLELFRKKQKQVTGL